MASFPEGHSNPVQQPVFPGQTYTTPPQTTVQLHGGIPTQTHPPVVTIPPGVRSRTIFNHI